METTANAMAFKESDFQSFRDWIDLDMESISWQGRYRKDFEDFWTLFFLDGLDLKNLIERFKYAQKAAKIGPLSSWFSWLKEKFLCYVYVTKGVGIRRLAKMANLELPYVAGVLRSFFVDKFPHLDEQLNSSFQIGNIAAENIDLDYQQLSQSLGLNKFQKGISEDEIMPSMEITLYDDWRHFLNKMKKDFFHPQFSFDRIKREASFKTQIKFLQEIIIMSFVGIGIIFFVGWINTWYEKYMANKISVYEPQFLWIEKTLKFRSKDDVVSSNFELDLDDIEKIPKGEQAKIERLGDEEERISAESNVVLTSWHSLPRDFDQANQEQSEYEEKKKVGLRDTTYGERKVYRVMMKSENPNSTKSILNGLLSKYEITQSDRVKPGTEVPGGVYYNLFVPRQFLKEFLSQVMESGEATLYESRTNVGNPPGKNKVFIWIKGL